MGSAGIIGNCVVSKGKLNKGGGVPVGRATFGTPGVEAGWVSGGEGANVGSPGDGVVRERNMFLRPLVY